MQLAPNPHSSSPSPRSPGISWHKPSTPGNTHHDDKDIPPSPGETFVCETERRIFALVFVACRIDWSIWTATSWVVLADVDGHLTGDVNPAESTAESEGSLEATVG